MQEAINFTAKFCAVIAIPILGVALYHTWYVWVTFNIRDQSPLLWNLYWCAVLLLIIVAAFSKAPILHSAAVMLAMMALLRHLI